MSKNAVVRIKRGLSSPRSNSGGICREIAQNEVGEESSISYKSTSKSNKVSFASNRKGVTSLTVWVCEKQNCLHRIFQHEYFSLEGPVFSETFTTDQSLEIGTQGTKIPLSTLLSQSSDPEP